ncbi:MAG: potassium channel family protein [Lachnospiraceae bacterium]|jgi:voltage-gated potassium channel|nr:potassium channel family protein [Lachnospiraceae bacterium]
MKRIKKLSPKQHLWYDIIISVLAVAAVVLAVIDIAEGLRPWQQKADSFILSIFTLDYFVRLLIAPKKGTFFTHNICDLIAILPFHTVFRAFKLARWGWIAKLGKLPRIFAFLYRPLKKAKVFFNTNGFKYVVFVTILMILTGGFLIHYAEGMSITDGIWWAFVTATTVGYGDISPGTFYGRCIAMVLMLVGIGLIGTVTSTLTSYFLNASKKRTVSDETLDLIKKQLDDFQALSREDVDAICKLLRALKDK